MKKTIDVTESVYARLERQARGFDTPSDVIERLLDSFERTNALVSIPINERQIEHPLDSEYQDRSSVSAKSVVTESTTKDSLDNSEIQRRISRVLARMSIENIDHFCGKGYSKEVFGINFPLLVKVPTTADSHARKDAVKDKGMNRWTWKFSFTKGDFDYAICTQWYRWHDDSVKRWLQMNEQTFHEPS